MEIQYKTQPIPADRRVWALALASIVLLALGVPRSASGANIPVTSFVQKVNATGGCSLQEAIAIANSTASAGSQTAIGGYQTDGTPITVTPGCAAGDASGGDTILLPTAGVFRLGAIVDDADNASGPTATPMITSNITIEANGATLQWTGTLNARLFTVGAGGVLTIRNAYIKGFRAHGGNGANGGGGGMGAGGAIYVMTGGQIVVENCTFDGNGAVGGNGSTNHGPSDGSSGEAGGGGGGLSGNGGGSDGLAGGGGGGSRGNGGDEDGGGTVFPGQSFDGPFNFKSGFRCGGQGAYGVGIIGAGNDGAPGQCPGGGGGGGATDDGGIISASGNGGNGKYGGGGGGGGRTSDGGSDGGVGGFGGGGGGGTTFDSNFLGDGPTGGDGGFGGGGGSAHGGYISGGPGKGGAFAGPGDNHSGGGGAALGGAIFNDSGSVTIRNSTFANNYVTRGLGSGTSDPGQDGGGAIFSRNGILEIVDATVSGNQGTGSGGGITVIGDGDTANFTLNDTIIFNNGSQECFVRGSVNMIGVTNLMGSNGNGGNFAPCPGALTGADPKLGPLQLNGPGITPTMAIPNGSPAQEAADASTSLAFDERGIPRPSTAAGPMTGNSDIGAFELCLELQFGHFLVTCTLPPSTATTDPLLIAVSPAGAGVTTPGVGTNFELQDSITTINTTPNPGYSFLNWTGNVADPNSALTTIIMNMPQTVTANFVSGTTILGGNILLKSGQQNARIWPVTIAVAGFVTAHAAQITSFSLTQTFGAACTPILLTNLPAIAGDISPGGLATVNLTFDFTGCATTVRFTAQATFAANGGGVSGSMIRTNQFQ